MMTKSDNSLTDELEITFEPYSDPSLKGMPPLMIEQFHQLSKMINKNARQVIPGLIELVDKHKNIPVLSNLLYAAYSMTNELDKAEKIAEESYKKFPEYLFSRVNYAHICLMKGELNKVPEILDHKFDLREIYPERKKFHITEFISFSGVTCWYFFETGEIEVATEIYNSLEEVAPEHEMTQVLKKRLNAPFVSKIFSKIIKKFR